jgi:DNA-directed RNA polymerase specialized sigma24 family protein
VAQLTVPKSESKRDWALTQSAFRRLLEWLDEGANSDGRRYLDIRMRLVRYFDRKNCLVPDDLADETLNRVARRLEEEGSIETDAPAHYCYIVARFVFMEYLRTPGVEALADSELPRRAEGHLAVSGDLAEELLEKERRSECLGHCLQSLAPDHRDLIMTYYTGDQRLKLETRRALAARLSITLNALSIRACRIRDKLEACVAKCLGAG